MTVISTVTVFFLLWTTSLKFVKSSWEGDGKLTPHVILHRQHKTVHADTIIRSFLPVTANAKQFRANDEMMYFNVSAVGKDEEVRRAELHLHRRRINKGPNYGLTSKKARLLPQPSRVLLYQVRPKTRRANHPRRLASVPVTTNTPGGWTTLDLTAVLNEIHGRSVLLGVRFEAPKSTRLTLLNFLKPLKNSTAKSMPAYLVLFSTLHGNDGVNDVDTELDVNKPKERHLKHKESKDEKNDMPNEIPSAVHVVRRSKEDEMALSRRNHIRSEPFLHTGEIADLRRILKKVKREIDNEHERISGEQRRQHSGDSTAMMAI